MNTSIDNSRTPQILLNHGSGGTLTANLVDSLFGKHFANPLLDQRTDAALVPVDGSTIAFTTDSFVVDPLIFPGGDIGKLAVCGTVNDLAVSGAEPLALSAAFILEEGMSLEILENIVESMGRTAREAGVRIVTGDTKVVQRGKGHGVFITTSGIGRVPALHAHISAAQQVTPGDKIIVSGPVGNHGAAIVIARNLLKVKSTILSDCAPLGGLIAEVLLACGDAVRFMRDPTRGGLATVLCELAHQRNVGVAIDESMIPVDPGVASLCDLLGFDPLYLANEGKVVLVVRPDAESRVLEVLRRHPLGRAACTIGSITSVHSGHVSLTTAIGGQRIIEMLAGDQLPRIC